MNESDAQFLQRMQSTSWINMPWSDVERMKRIEKDKRAKRFAAILRRPR